MPWRNRFDAVAYFFYSRFREHRDTCSECDKDLTPEQIAKHDEVGSDKCHTYWQERSSW